MSFEKYIEKSTKKKKKLYSIMVRPDEETCEWLEKQAEIHGVSANKIVLAIILAAKMEPKIRGGK